MRIDAETALVLGVAGVAALAGVYLMRNGVAGAAAGVVNAAGEAASGAVGAIGAAVGLPTPSETTTDAAVARWIIDNRGYGEASMWAGLPALLSAIVMPAGSGTPPAIGTAAHAALVQNWRESAPSSTGGIFGGWQWLDTGWSTDTEAQAYQRDYEARWAEADRLSREHKGISEAEWAAVRELDRARPVTGQNGAAFGIYPKP